MNTNTTTRIGTSLFAATVAVVACVATASPASANHAREGAGQSGSVTVLGSYAQPLVALDGSTLAQYLEEKQSRDPRTFAGV